MELDGASQKTLDDDSLESVSVFLVWSRATHLICGEQESAWRDLLQRTTFISVPDTVTDLCDYCFRHCNNLSRVPFGKGSSLKRIGVQAFHNTGLTEIDIPDSVEELCEACFSLCGNLHRVTLRKTSRLKCIGVVAFQHTCYTDSMEILIPKGVEQLGDQCFYECRYLLRLTFGESPSLKRIGAEAFLTGFLSPDIIFPPGTPDGVEGISRCV